VKVYIGPYRNTWWNTQRVWKKWLEWNHKKSYWQIEEEDHTKWDKRVDKTLDWWHDHINVPLNKLWFHKRKRKIKIRIDNYDIWNMDYTLSLIIVPMLKELKNTKHGTPMVDDKDVPKHLRSTAAPPKENEWDTDALLESRWEYVLGEMIYAFECTADPDWENQFYSGEHDIQWVDVEIDGKKYKQMKKGPNDTFKSDDKAMDAAWKRRKEGLRLFGKYYHSLWD